MTLKRFMAMNIVVSSLRRRAALSKSLEPAAPRARRFLVSLKCDGG
jgi:hypothetical protein